MRPRGTPSSSRRCSRWWTSRAGRRERAPTIQALLAARIDQLRAGAGGARARRGGGPGLPPWRRRRHWLRRIRRSTTHLMGLVRKELVRPSPAVLPDDDAFRFRHLLIRDAAYEALPKADPCRAPRALRRLDRGARSRSRRARRDPRLPPRAGGAVPLRARDAVSRGRARRASSYLGGAGTRALERSDLHAAAEPARTRNRRCSSGTTRQRVRLLPALAEAVYGSGEFERTHRAPAAGDRTRPSGRGRRGVARARHLLGVRARAHGPGVEGRRPPRSSTRSWTLLPSTTTTCSPAPICRAPGSCTGSAGPATRSAMHGVRSSTPPRRAPGARGRGRRHGRRGDALGPDPVAGARTVHRRAPRRRRRPSRRQARLGDPRPPAGCGRRAR